MKKIIFFLIFVSLILSCKTKNDGKTAISEPSILGKWFIKGEVTNDGEFQNHIHDCESSKDFQEFFANRKLIFNNHNVMCEISETQKAIWNLDGNALNISSLPTDTLFYDYTYVVESLTNNELILKLIMSESEGTVEYVITYTRN